MQNCEIRYSRIVICLWTPRNFTKIVCTMLVHAKETSVNASVLFLRRMLLSAHVKEPSSSGAIKFPIAVNNVV